ncbi:hypothetical protein Acr_14g0004680 [Actinidia rufa]|uniref:Uncharacterized protein n=1 Tax=Actinidia rufa TaxID=165716 RepID=A0A7J0FQ31_9ERIC|nr:hypothetical protein Acr_14g0004680 [Actinidia rufa]
MFWFLSQNSTGLALSTKGNILGARLQGGLGYTGGLGMGCKVGRERKGWTARAEAGAAGGGAWGLLAGLHWAVQHRGRAAQGGCSGGAGTTELCGCVGRRSYCTEQCDNFAGAERGGPRRGWITRLRKGCLAQSALDRVVAAQRREEEGCTEASGWWLLG